MTMCKSDDQSLGPSYASEIFSLESYDIEEGRVVALRGELDASTSSDLDTYLIGPSGGLVVVDLSQLTFIDSSGLGVLHKAWRRAVAEEGSLVVSRPCPAVERVLEITGLDIWIHDWDQRWAEPVGHRSSNRLEDKGPS